MKAMNRYLLITITAVAICLVLFLINSYIPIPHYQILVGIIIMLGAVSGSITGWYLMKRI